MAVTDRTEPQSVGLGARSAQPVVLVDRIAWQWYLATAVVPFFGALVGFVAGIVFMARSKIGPALALWGTALLAWVVWGLIGWLVLFSLAWDEAFDDDPRAGVSQRADGNPREFEVEPEPSVAPEPASEPADEPDASTAPAQDRDARNTKTCGNLRVATGSTTCGFAQNVFWEYWTASSGGLSHTDDIRAYSSALGKWLTLTCFDGDPVVCRNDAGAEVQIPREAVVGYTKEAADAYAADHTVSGG